MKPSQAEGLSQVFAASDSRARQGWLRRRARMVVALVALAFPACSAESLPGSEHADIAEPARHLLPPPVLTAPADGATLIAEQPLFTWQIDKCHERIRLELCADAACAVVSQSFESATCTGTRPPSALAPGTYFWRAARVRGQHLASTFSAVARFVLAPPPPVVTADLYGVFSVSASEVFAVGADGTLLRYSGAWGAETSPTTQTLYAVWATAGGQAFAVGAGGTLLHRDGAAWTAIPSPTTVPLTGVWGSTSSDVWAVGGSLILHWNGTSFAIAHDRTAGTLQGISGSAANDIWATGSGREPDNDYAALLLHWDGTSWSESYICNPEGTRFASGGWIASLPDVWGLPGGAFWAAGVCQSGASFIPYGYIAQKASDGPWGDTAGFGFGLALGKFRPLRTIWASGPGDVWAASASETVAGSTELPTMLHFDGATWTPSPQASTVGILDLGGTSASDVWAVGKGGKRLHFDGTTWTAAP